MEYKIVPILSSREFYKMIDILNEILEYDDTCILDFTDVVRIDAVVVPNLLFLGKYIEKKTGNIPYIRLGEDLSAGYLKNYLMGIKFFELSDLLFNYEDLEGRYCGLAGKKMDKRNTTERFLFADGYEVAYRRLYYNILPFIDNYLGAFGKDITNSKDVLDSNAIYNNEITHLLYEMIENAFTYAESDVIITVQTNYNKERILIAISDSGRGFLGSMKDDKNMDEEGNFLPKIGAGDRGINILGRRPKNEEEALLIGIYKRMKSKTYGLFNVIKKVLDLKGIIRIHSNDRQVIITERLKSQFLQGKLFEKLEQLKGYNVIETSLFEGVHLEIELPLNFYNEES